MALVMIGALLGAKDTKLSEQDGVYMMLAWHFLAWKKTFLTCLVMSSRWNENSIAKTLSKFERKYEKIPTGQNLKISNETVQSAHQFP